MHLIILACHKSKLSNTVIVAYQSTLVKITWLPGTASHCYFPASWASFVKKPNFRIWRMPSAEYLLSSRHRQVKRKLKWNLDQSGTSVLKPQMPSQRVTISAKGFWIVFLESYYFLCQEEAGSIVMVILSFTLLHTSSAYLWPGSKLAILSKKSPMLKMSKQDAKVKVLDLLVQAHPTVFFHWK